MTKPRKILLSLCVGVIPFVLAVSAIGGIMNAPGKNLSGDIGGGTLIYDRNGNTVVKYTLSFSAVNGTISGKEGLYSSGDSIDLAAVPDEGYVFSGWTSSSGGVFSDKDNELTTYRIPSRSVTITANFTKLLTPGSAPVLSVLGSDVSYEFDTLVSNGFSTHLTTVGNPALSIEGDKLKVARTGGQDSMRLKLGALEKGRRYKVTFTMSYDSGKTGNLRIFPQPNSDGYIKTAAFNGMPVDISMEFDYTDDFINAGNGRTTIHASASSSTDTSTIYIHSITVEDKGAVAGYTDSTPKKDLGYSTANPSLYARYKDNFMFGAALNNSIVNGTSASASVYNGIVDQNFTSMTAENSMKPDSTLDQNKSKANLNSSDPEMKGMPGINTESIDRNLKYAIDRGLKVRYHVLIWHSQFPSWFFFDNYDAGTGNVISKEVLIKRMESYIKQVFEYINTVKYNGVYYKDVIYTYDVVNEAITDDAKKFYFYTIFNGGVAGTKAEDYAGDIEYISYSFLFARKYADPGATLIYNDYNCYIAAKREAIYNMVSAVNDPGNKINTTGKKLIDGVGMQMHIGVSWPEITNGSNAIDSAILKFASLGVEVQITELDVGGSESTPNNNITAAAQRYKSVMQKLYDLDNNPSNGVDITSVSVWGVSDKDSWIFGQYCSYPLLFGSDLSANNAYYAMFLDDELNKQ